MDQIMGLLPENLANVSRKAVETSRRGEYISLLELRQIKNELRKKYGATEGFSQYKEIMGLGPNVYLRTQVIVSQLEEAESSAADLRIVHYGGTPEVQTLPEFIGNPNTCLISGKTRRVFIACFEHATAYGRSSTIRLKDGRFAFDLQEGEISLVPVDPAFDPVVFHYERGHFECIEDLRPSNRLEIPEALSLLGPDSVSYGHWLMEEYHQFHTFREQYGLRGMPVLIDSEMPAQHIESLKAFLGEHYPIIVIPRTLRVEAERLWIVSNWFYSPKLLLTDKNLDLSTSAGATAEAIMVYSRAFAELERGRRLGSSALKVFLAREPTRHRAIVNYEEIVALLTKHGYQIVYPEKLSFMEQYDLIRASRYVVCQAGSAVNGLWMCSPGTDCLLLSHQYLPFIGAFNRQLEYLSVRLKVLIGPACNNSLDYNDISSYTIDLHKLEAAIEAMEEAA